MCLFLKIIECLEKSNTRLNTKNSEKIDCKKPSNTKNEWIKHKICLEIYIGKVCTYIFASALYHVSITFY